MSANSNAPDVVKAILKMARLQAKMGKMIYN